MLEHHEFCDNCPGCRPSLLDLKTQQPMPNDHPIMVAINDWWDNESSYEQRHAFIEVTLHNSRNPIHNQRARVVVEKFQEIIELNST